MNSKIRYSSYMLFKHRDNQLLTPFRWQIYELLNIRLTWVSLVVILAKKIIYETNFPSQLDFQHFVAYFC